MDDLVARTWQKIQQEAQSMAAQEPMLASFFHSTILNHRDLRSALSFQLANKLDSTTMPAIALREVIGLARRSEPELLAAVAADICAVQDRDPAVDLFSTPLLYLKGFHALQGYRVANWLWRQGRRALALYLEDHQALSPQSQLLVIAPAPLGQLTANWRALFGGKEAESHKLVSLWQRCCAARGVAMLDITPLLSPLADGLHWSVDDHQRIADAVGQLINPHGV